MPKPRKPKYHSRAFGRFWPLKRPAAIIHPIRGIIYHAGQPGPLLRILRDPPRDFDGQERLVWYHTNAYLVPDLSSRSPTAYVFVPKETE